MRAITIQVAFMFAVSSHCYGQIDTLWTRVYDSGFDDIPNSIVLTDSNQFVVAGVSYAGDSNIKCLRYSLDGVLQADDSYSIVRNHEVAESVIQSFDGSIVLTGMTHPYTWDLFVLKIASDGDTLWSGIYGNHYYDDGTYGSGAIKQTGDGGYVVTGFSSCSYVRHNVYFVRIDQNGNLISERCWQNPSSWDHGKDIIVLADDNVMICGYTGANVFGQSNGGYDAYLMKTDIDGNTLFSEQYGGTDDDGVHSIVQTESGDLIMAGYSNSFGSGDYDFYVIKVDASGALLWERHFGGELDDKANKIAKLSDDRYLIAGSTNGDNEQGKEILLIEIDGLGNQISSMIIDGYGDSEITDLCVYGNDLAYFCAKSVPYPGEDVNIVTGVISVNSQQQNGILQVSFNNSGTLPPGWTTQSNATVLTTPWAPILESGTDYAVQTSQVAFSTPRTEWLISPIYNLTGYQGIELGYTHTYTHAGSTATVKYSTNGGLSWQNLANYNATTSGNIATNIAGWANNQANVRFAFVFTGTFNIGGASWRIDDFFLDGTRTAPLASTPVPSQPPTAWASLTGNVGCTWTQPLGVSGTDLEVRIDANGDGDYLDGGAENWQPVAELPDSSSLTFSTSVTYLQAGTDLAFEFRARSGQGLWGYSGTSSTEGIEDDWVVSIDVDTTPPTFADPIPTDQPNPDWLPTLQPQVGASVLDADSGVDASTLAWRIDLDQNGSYSGPAEDWQPITGHADGSQIDLIQTATLPADGEYRVEFRAQDLVGNGPAHSLGEEGITDDIVVRVDTTPPTPSTLFVAGSGLDSVTLMFSPTSDDHFTRYEIRCSTDTLVDESDLLWTDAQDPNLAQIGTYQTSITGLSSGTAWYFSLWAVDQAGNRSQASNLVRKVTEGSQVSPVTDLQAVLQGNDILLSWTAPATDIFGQSPVAIEEYQVHSSLDARFTPNASTLVGTTTSMSYLVVNPGGDVRAFYRVVVVGAGPGNPVPVPMIRVPAGTFQMGQVGVAEPVHQVTLTHDFWLGETEVTNQQYLEALNWANAQGLVTVVGDYVKQYDVNLLWINASGYDVYEIRYNADTQLFHLQAGTHDGGEWGPGEAYPGGGYDPSNQPVKYVTWYGAACYCDWRSQMEDLPHYYGGQWGQIPMPRDPYDATGYRLPTEAEWEFAAQHDDDRAYPWGSDTPNCTFASFNSNSCFLGWTSPVGAHPVGASSLGLQDMAGNVWEWCNDWSSSYSSSPQSDPVGPASGYGRIGRGGSWGFSAESLPCAGRGGGGDVPWGSHSDVGFRICRTAQ